MQTPPCFRRQGSGCSSEFQVQFLVLVRRWWSLEQGRSSGHFSALPAGPAPDAGAPAFLPLLSYTWGNRLQEIMQALSEGKDVHLCSLPSCLGPELLGGAAPEVLSLVPWFLHLLS